MIPFVRNTILERLQTYKQKHDRHLKLRTFAVGDFVRLRQPDIEHEQGHLRKLRSNWTGPWLVLERMGENNVKIQHSNNPGDVQSVNVERIAPFYVREEEAAAQQEPQHVEQEEEELQEDREYEVERIVKERESPTRAGQKDYWIKWKGYRKSENSWVAEGDLQADELLQAWRLRNQTPSNAHQAKSTDPADSNTAGRPKRSKAKKIPAN
jgi:hypothetical protein